MAFNAKYVQHIASEFAALPPRAREQAGCLKVDLIEKALSGAPCVGCAAGAKSMLREWIHGHDNEVLDKLAARPDTIPRDVSAVQVRLHDIVTLCRPKLVRLLSTIEVSEHVSASISQDMSEAVPSAIVFAQLLLAAAGKRKLPDRARVRGGGITPSAGLASRCGLHGSIPVVRQSWEQMWAALPWDRAVDMCKVPIAEVEETLQVYLRDNQFCPSCSSNVNTAFELLAGRTLPAQARYYADEFLPLVYTRLFLGELPSAELAEYRASALSNSLADCVCKEPEVPSELSTQSGLTWYCSKPWLYPYNVDDEGCPGCDAHPLPIPPVQDVAAAASKAQLITVHPLHVPCLLEQAAESILTQSRHEERHATTLGRAQEEVVIALGIAIHLRLLKQATNEARKERESQVALCGMATALRAAMAEAIAQELGDPALDALVAEWDTSSSSRRARTRGHHGHSGAVDSATDWESGVVVKSGSPQTKKSKKRKRRRKGGSADVGGSAPTPSPAPDSPELTATSSAASEKPAPDGQAPHCDSVAPGSPASHHAAASTRSVASTPGSPAESRASAAGSTCDSAGASDAEDDAVEDVPHDPELLTLPEELDALHFMANAAGQDVHAIASACNVDWQHLQYRADKGVAGICDADAESLDAVRQCLLQSAADAVQSERAKRTTEFTALLRR